MRSLLSVAPPDQKLQIKRSSPPGPCDTAFDAFPCIDNFEYWSHSFAARELCSAFCGPPRAVVEGGGWVGNSGRNSIKQWGGRGAAGHNSPWVVPATYSMAAARFGAPYGPRRVLQPTPWRPRRDDRQPRGCLAGLNGPHDRPSRLDFAAAVTIVAALAPALVATMEHGRHHPRT